MWKDLPEQWKAVFCEAWDAMKSGSVPSGAVIYDKEGNLLAGSHNGFKNTDVNPYTSHSCINAINQLSLRDVESNNGLTIYSSMEPCLMCLGAIAISNIKEIHSASRDLFLRCNTSHIR
ncbi:MAG: tRNA-specific adenosine deaminase [Firmicutes bacterium ADurb.BinA205]|nr:MAG: tRNA-specific adenosine deaminase [Firmicutes bacterium ADurb.BinA205]